VQQLFHCEPGPHRYHGQEGYNTHVLTHIRQAEQLPFDLAQVHDVLSSTQYLPAGHGMVPRSQQSSSEQLQPEGHLPVPQQAKPEPQVSWHVAANPPPQDIHCIPSGNPKSGVGSTRASA